MITALRCGVASRCAFVAASLLLVACSSLTRPDEITVVAEPLPAPAATALRKGTESAPAAAPARPAPSAAQGAG